MATIRDRSLLKKSRGRSRIDGLDSLHTFRFASYHDPMHMGFRSLRVIHQDRVAPGGGFATDPLHFLQIWIQPREANLPPTYSDWYPDPSKGSDHNVLLISPDGRDGVSLDGPDTLSITAIQPVEALLFDLA